MNKIYKIKWSAHTQRYVVCSELVKSCSKAARSVVLRAVVLGGAFLGSIDTVKADECPSWNINTNITCEITSPTQVADVSNGSAGLSVGGATTTRTINVGIQSDLTFDLTAIRGPYHPKGISIHGGIGQDLTQTSNVTATNHHVTINLKQKGGASTDVPVIGLYTVAGAKFEGKDLTINAVTSNHMGGLTESYAIQVGTAQTGDDKRVDATSVVKVENLNISLTNTADSISFYHQLTGIRVINGGSPGNSRTSAAYFESTGDVNIHVFDSSDAKTAAYINGIYISGPSSNNKVVLNNSKILIETVAIDGQFASALRIGKGRSVGTGGGTIESKGHMELDTTAAKSASTVNLVGENSLLKADYDTSSGDIKSASTAIHFGAPDSIFSTVNNNQKALFKDTKITTSNDTRDALIQMSNGTNALFSLKGDKSEAIASTQAYLVNVDANSVLQVNATDAGQMTGLTNKTETSTLNLNLDNHFAWNLREHTAADGSSVKTATFNTTTLTNGASINAIKGDGTATFTLQGNVDSKGGLIRLSDKTTTALLTDGQAKAGDILTITTNYTAENGKVLLDTVLGDDSSQTDLLYVMGNSAGTNTVEVTPVSGSLGNLTQQGIKVVQVDGASDTNTNYVLKGDGIVSDDSLTIGADNKHKFTYRLYQGTLNHPGTGTDNGIPAGVDTTGIDSNDWYLRSVCSNGSHQVGSGFTASTYDGLGCMSDDTITVTSGANLAKIESAGGSDIILINSDAKVSSDVYGGHGGMDNSTNKDGNDTITITDTAVVNGTVYGQAGDDSITWSGHSSVGGVNGGIGSDTVTVASSKYDGTQLLDGGDDADVSDGWIDTLNLSGLKVTVNGDNIRHWERINLKGTELTLLGELMTSKGKDGMQVGVTIDSDATLAVSGQSAKVTGHILNNSGTIDLTKDGHVASQTLTIDGDYVGGLGSQVKMNTVWNKTGDASGANSTSDILTITGSATGQTRVIPVSSDGVERVISGDVEQISAVINTIPVITVGKTGSERVFMGSAVTPSGIEAQLAKRVVNGVDQYFWTIDSIKTPVGPVVPNNPTYDPRVPGYVLMSRVNTEQGYATLRTLHERRGENQTLAWDNCGTCGEQANGQTWGRLIGSNLEVDGKYRLGFETKSYGFQFGHDFAISRTDEGGHRLTGAYVSYNHANTTFKDEFSRENGELLADKTAGKGKSDAWSLGVTHTRYSPFGAYLDLVGQVSFYRNKYEPRKYNDISQNGMGVVLSAEVGKPYALSDRQPGESGWMIEPQAQLIYQMVDLKGFNDGVRRVDQGIQHGLRGRIGARLAYHEKPTNGAYRTDTFYAVANIWHDFVKPTSVKLAGNKLREEHTSTWAEVGIGMQLPIGKQTHIYGDARYERELGGAKREGYRGTVGVKYTWN